MATFNKVTLLGRLTKDVELRYTPSGSPVANFTVASNESYTKDGVKKEETLFVQVDVWGTLAENCSKFISKGKEVLLEGKLKLKKWSAQDGTERSMISITALNVQFLSAQEKTGEGESKPKAEMSEAEKAIADAFEH